MQQSHGKYPDGEVLRGKEGTRLAQNLGIFKCANKCIVSTFHRLVTGEQVKNGLGRCVLAALFPEHIHLQVPEQLLGRDFQLGLEAINLVSSSHLIDGRMAAPQGGWHQEGEPRTPLVRAQRSSAHKGGGQWPGDLM